MAGALVLEGLLRLAGFGASYLRWDRNTRWSLEPGYDGPGPDLPHVAVAYGLRVNRLGFRGGEIPREKPPGVIRYAALGDSVAFGFGRRAVGFLRRRLRPPEGRPPRPTLPRVPPEEFEANLRAIVEVVRRSGARALLLTPPAAFGPDRPPDAYFREDWTVPREELEPLRL